MSELTNPSQGPLDKSSAAAMRAERQKVRDQASTSMMSGNDRRDKSQYDHGATADIDLNELRAARQTGWDKLGNGSVKFLNTGVGSILEGAGVIGGAATAAGAELIQATTGYGDGWDSDTVFKNPFVEYVSHLQDEVRDLVPHYASKEEEALTAMQRLGTANFWTDTMAEAAGFMAGAMVPAGLITKLGKGFLMANMAARAGKIDILTNLVGSTAAASRFKKVADGTSLFVGAMAGRVGESAIEANGVYDEVFKNAIDQGMTEGRAIALARDARASTFGLNMMLAVPDMFQYAKIFGTFKESTDMVRTLKRAADGTYEMAKRGVGKKIFDVAKPLISNMAVESQEENYQLAVGNMAKGIAFGKYDGDSVDTWQKMMGAIGSEMTANFFTKEGQESMLAGAILGGGMMAPTTIMNERQKTQYTSAALQRHNDIIKTQQDNVLAFATLENEKNKAAEDGNRLMYDTAKQIQFNNWVRAKIEIGKFDEAIMEMEAWGKDTPLKQAELNKAGVPKNPDYVVRKAIDEARRLQKIYDSVEGAFPNLDPAAKHYLYHNLSMQQFMDKKIAKLSLDEAELNAQRTTAEASGVPFQASLDQIKAVKDKKSLLEAKATLVQEYQDLLDPTKREERLAKIAAETKKEEAKKAPEAAPATPTTAAPEGNLPPMPPSAPTPQAGDVNDPSAGAVKAGTFTPAFGGATAPGGPTAPGSPAGPAPTAPAKYTPEDIVSIRKEMEGATALVEEGLKQPIDINEMSFDERKEKLADLEQLIADHEDVADVSVDMKKTLNALKLAVKKLKDAVYQAYEGRNSPETRYKEELSAIKGVLAFVKSNLYKYSSKEIEDEMIPLSKRIQEFESEFGSSDDLNALKKDYEEIRKAYKEKLAKERPAGESGEGPGKIDPNFYSKVQTAYIDRDEPNTWKDIQTFNAAVKKGHKPTEIWVVFENDKYYNVYTTFNGKTIKLGYLNQPDYDVAEEISGLNDPINQKALDIIEDIMDIADANPDTRIPIDVELLTNLDYSGQSFKPLTKLDDRFKDTDGQYHIYRVRKNKQDTTPSIVNMNTKMPVSTEDHAAIMAAGGTDGYVVRVTDPSGRHRYVGLETVPLSSFEEIWEIVAEAIGKDAATSYR